MELIEAADRSDLEAGQECDVLKALILTTKEQSSPDRYGVYNDAIESLQWVFSQYHALPDPVNRHIFLAWPVRLSSEYLKLLNVRDPEAMVILAHWAILLHRGREFWVFGHAGRFLVQNISTYLGESWAHWMVSPMQTISDD